MPKRTKQPKAGGLTGEEALGLGDWVQAVLEVMDTDGLLYARPGDIGHVVDVTNRKHPMVYFERLNRASIVDLVEVKRLCGPDAGRYL